MLVGGNSKKTISPQALGFEGRPAQPESCAQIAYSPETGSEEMPNRGASGIVNGSDITFRCQRWVVSNLSVRLASCIDIDIVLFIDLPSGLPHSQS